MENQFSRSELLLGKEGIKKLNSSRIAVFGIGGVGGYVAEALVRSGIGKIDIIDNDDVAFSNLNRQIIALHSTIGRPKVDVMKERLLDINPNCEIKTHKVFYMPETENLFDFTEYDYIVDAIDTVTGKLSLIVNAKNADTPIISSMGAGNKSDPTAFCVEDIYKTSVCPLARAMRAELKKRNIKSLKVVYSKEKPIKATVKNDEQTSRHLPGSTAFVPPVVGLIIAGEVIKDLIK